MRFVGRRWSLDRNHATEMRCKWCHPTVEVGLMSGIGVTVEAGYIQYHLTSHAIDI